MTVDGANHKQINVPSLSAKFTIFQRVKQRYNGIEILR